MNPKAKLKEISLIGGLILALVMSIVIFSSKKELSVTPSEAAGNGNIFDVTPSDSPVVASKPTLLPPRNQDVPLKVLGSKQEIHEPSYLYTELTSKGLVSNVSSTSASVIWLTEAPQLTLLKYGIRESQLVRKFTGQNPTYIHEAKLENLSPNTLYYYTGHAPIIDSFTTAPTLSTPPFAQKISGTFTGGEGTCLIRGMLSRGIETSAFTTISTKTAKWELPLTGLRKADYSGYFSESSTDILEIDVLCVSEGKVLYSGSKKQSLGISLKSKVNIRLYRDN